MQKQPEKMDVFEASKLLDYKLYQMNLNEFGQKVNKNSKQISNAVKKNILRSYKRKNNPQRSQRNGKDK